MFFKVQYCLEKATLTVIINKCTNLQAKNPADNSRLKNVKKTYKYFYNFCSDPYIRLQILPDKQHNVKTKVFHRNLNPAFEEEFTFYGIHFNRLQVLLNLSKYSY